MYLLIDIVIACYENKTKLFCSSEVPIFQVFSDKHGSAAEDAHMQEGKSFISSLTFQLTILFLCIVMDELVRTIYFFPLQERSLTSPIGS